MKKIVFIFAAAIAVCPLYAQVIVNPDGTHSVVHGSHIVSPDGNISAIHGNHIVGSDGKISVVHGNHIISLDGNISVVDDSIFEDRGKRRRNKTLIDVSDSGNKIVVNIDGTSITFDSKKSYKKIRRLVKKETRRINRHMRRS